MMTIINNNNYPGIRVGEPSGWVGESGIALGELLLQLSANRFRVGTNAILFEQPVLM